jgi:hypothetical protein
VARIKVLEEAADEAIEAAAWYEEQRPGLGIEFAQAFHAALDFLEEEIARSCCKTDNPPSRRKPPCNDPPQQRCPIGH